VKNKFGLFGLIALTAIIGFSTTGCNQPTDRIPLVDKTTLGNAITEAHVLLTRTVESVGGIGISFGYWAPQAAIDAFAVAIATAQSVRYNTAATQVMVNNAIETLAAAQTAFIAARRPGTYTPTTVDRTVLGNAIAAAQILIAGTATSMDGNDVATTAYWTTAVAHTAFANAIAIAQSVQDNATATQAEVDTAVSNLADARAIFMAARELGTSATAVDRTLLGSAIAAANTLLAGTVVSDDGIGITSGYWAPQAAINAFTAAVATAQGVYGNAVVTQAMVNVVTSNLETAQATFTATRQPGVYVPVDRTALGNTIAAAWILIAGTVTSTDGNDVATTAYWATATVHTAFESAITMAQGVYDNAAATQATINTAVSDLTIARATFMTARELGTSATAVDKTALGTAVAAASTLLAPTVPSNDGTGITSGYWAPQAAIENFTTAIATAQGVYGNTAATQAEVNTAVSNLAAAQMTFTAARQSGVYVPVNRTALGNAITLAQTLISGVAISTDGNDVATTAYWVTATAHTAFTDAITAAQSTFKKTTATQAEVNTAVSNLGAARTTFMTARELGTSATAVDRTALGTAVAAASTLLAPTVASNDGIGITSGYWAPQAAIDNFATAIATAQGVYGNAAATQAEVNTAVSNLEAAQMTFTAARQSGTYVPVDRTALGNAIAVADILLTPTVPSNDGTGITSGYWAPQAAIDNFTTAIATAQGVYGNTAATQAEVNTAVSNLAAAQMTFTAARQPGTYVPTPVDKTALANAILAAQTLLNTPASEDGTGISGYWAPQAAINNFATAVAMAQSVYGNTAATQAEVKMAVSNLANAQEAFNAIVNYAHTLTGTVTITGNPYVGLELTASTINLGGTRAISFQWLRGGTVVGTGETYIVQATDAGYAITVMVTRAGYYGSVASNPVMARHREGFTIRLADFYTMEYIEGPTIHLTTNPARATAYITVEDPERYEAGSIMWFFGGTRITGGLVGSHDETLRLGSHIHDNLLGIGEHVVTVEARRRNGALYSQRITFTVVR